MSEPSTGSNVSTTNDTIQYRILVNCAGLRAERIAIILGAQIDCQIVPFKGKYFRLPAKFNDLVKHVVYPISDLKLSFSRVHLTRMIDGTITLGTNAVMAVAEQG